MPDSLADAPRVTQGWPIEKLLEAPAKLGIVAFDGGVVEELVQAV